MTGSRRTLWWLWAMFLASLALELAIPHLVPSRQDPWYAAQTAVAGFVLALLSLTAGVATFALRETLVLRDVRAGVLDARSPGGFARIRTVLLALWALCLLIGLFGSVLAYGAASPRAAWPYVFAAAVLLVLHAPRERLFAASPARP